MRILIVHGIVGRGGDAVQMQELISACINIGYQTKVLGTSPLQPYNQSSSQSKVRNLIRRIPWYLRDIIEVCTSLLLCTRVFFHLKFNPTYDIIFIRSSIYDITPLVFQKHKKVLVLCDANFPEERKYKKEGYFKKCFEIAFEMIRRHAKIVLVPSHHIALFCQSNSISSDKISIIQNCVSSDFQSQALKLSCQYPPFANANNPCVVGYIGSMAQWHKVENLIAAVESLHATYGAHWKAQIIGNGHNLAELQRITKTRNLASSVEFLHSVPHNETPKYIARFDIAVLPATLSSGTPMKLIEYASLARPIIAPDLQNIRLLFSNNEIEFIENGSVSDLASAIYRLSHDKIKSRDNGIQCQKAVQHLQWEKQLKQVFDKFA